jgi:hypothetical protein
MTLAFSNCTYGFLLGGQTPCGRYASGKIVEIFPGIGFLVENDFYKYLIINNFSAGLKMHSNYLESLLSDYNNTSITDETIIFWLNAGFSTKSCIYGIELNSRRLIDPMDVDGITLRTKLHPLINSEMYYNGFEKNWLWGFLKETGENYIDEVGNLAPLPYESYINNEVLHQESKWHLLRARILNEGDVLPYKYTFLQCGKRMLIEIDGKKKSTVNYLGGDVHMYTPVNSTLSSPTSPFVMYLPPIEENDELLWGGEDKFVERVKRLSDSNIDEGIEEMYWEMKRLRGKSQTESEDFLNAHKWLDAAYDEKQFRREQTII